MTADSELSEPERVVIRGYEPRLPLLQSVAQRLQAQAEAALNHVEHIDRISFRAKGALSFSRKALALTETGERKYTRPFEDIEDQVAGRVLVFFRRDIENVAQVLTARFNRVEQETKSPARSDAFAYESEHLVFAIPPNAMPSTWMDLVDPPTTFEIQIRTLFMHAWAEPQHNIAYKPSVTLTNDEKRSLAWAASNAWGGDTIFEQLLTSISTRN